MTNSTNQIPDILAADFLIVGSGLAGLLLTLKLMATGASVVLASKGSLTDSNTSYAQGGVAVSLPTNQFDSPEMHFEDTIKSGCGLVDPVAAREVIFSGIHLVHELTKFGVNFDLDDSGALSLSREGGHSRPRVIHDKDTTGRSIITSLIETLKVLAKTQPLTILEHAFTQSLLLKDEVCLGAHLEIDKRQISVLASHTVLATGGLGQVYSRTTNPLIATGDGIALAYRAGAALVDMEFVQFHPTVLALPHSPPFLISEAVRGAGAVLLDGKGERFMTRFHADSELATRDVVARAIHSVMLSEASASVFLDLTGIGGKTLLAKFPNIVNTVRHFGIDPVCEPIPVSPAAHYFMGGIMTDLNGNTNISGLSAVGECASIGLHGANRLASNSLLEAGVMAIKTANYLSKLSTPSVKTRWSPNQAGFDSPPMTPKSLGSLQEKMYAAVGLIRNNNSLREAQTFLRNFQSSRPLSSQTEFEASNIQLLSTLITESALQRNESRGAHFRDDCQQTLDGLYTKRLVVRRAQYTWQAVGKTTATSQRKSARQLAAVGNS